MAKRTVHRRFNKLIGKTATQLMLDNGSLDDSRHVGSTTATALKTIATAIQNPGVSVEYSDHEGSRRMNEYLRQAIRTVVNRLDLRFIDIDRHQFTIKFDLWDEGVFLVGEEEAVDG